MIGAIEQAIVDRIEAASGAGTLGYTIRTVASYGNELDDNLKSVVRQFPAVWVVFMGERKPRQAAGGEWVHEPLFAVMVAARNRRNEEAARRGAAGKPGSYQMFEDVRALLTGQDLGLDIAPFAPGAVRSLVNGAVQGAAASIYAHEFHTRYVSNEPAAASGLDDFAAFHVDWDIPPLGNVTGPLPAEEADAEDTIEVETS